MLIIMSLSEKMLSQIHNDMGLSFIENYTPDFYKASSQNWAVVQDLRGVFYFGNNDGILEHDGNSWKIIRMPHNLVVRSLDIDSNHVIFAGGSGEFGFLKPNANHELQYFSLSKNLKNKNLGEIWKTFATKNGIYFLSGRRQIFKYHKNKLFELNIPEKFKNIRLFHLFNQFFFADEAEGFGIIRSDSLQTVSFGKELFAAYAMLPFEKDKILVATSNKGLYIWDFLNNSLKKFDTPFDNFLTQSKIYYGIQLKNQNYAFGTLLGGLIILTPDGKNATVYNRIKGILANGVYCLTEDMQGNLWLGLENGISQIQINSPFNKYSQINGLEGKLITASFFNKKLYVGTSTGTYVLADTSNFNIEKPQQFLPIDKQYFYVLHFATLENQTRKIFLAAALRNLVQIIDNQHVENITDIYGVHAILPSKRVTGRIFLGYSKGLKVLKTDFAEPKANFFEEYDFSEFEDEIASGTLDKAGNLWLATTHNGIIHIKFDRNESLTNYNIFRYDTTSGLPDANNNKVYFIHDKIIATTTKGLYSLITLKTKPFWTHKFVPDSSFGFNFQKDKIRIFHLHSDKHKNTWFITSNGVYKLAYISNESKRLLSRPFKIISRYDKENIILTQENGIAWFLNSDALFRYNPSKENQTPQILPTLIRKVILSNNKIIYGGGDANYGFQTKKFHIIYSENIPYQFNTIEFEFSNPSYENQNSNQYSWFLEGYDEKWNEWTSKNYAKYTNLSEGKYIFRVKGKNIFEIESAEAIYEFRITPPWYRTWWTYLSILIILGFLFYFGMKLYAIRLKITNRRLENLVRIRTSQLEKQNEKIHSQAELLARQHTEIKDSIDYASQIQKAMLPPKSLIDGIFQKYFILYLPRDIVSGDFYWITSKKNFIIIAVADCTGHGVPGAFMSMLGITLLKTIVNQQEILSSNEILNHLREMLILSLHQRIEESESSDGMDMAICVLNNNTLKLEYSGANNPLYVVRNQELTVYKADKMPIGVFAFKDEPFTKHEIQLQRNDTLYMFSDGFIDQFGGKYGKKFLSTRFQETIIAMNKLCLSISEQKLYLEDVFKQWKGKISQIDDILIVGIKI